MKLDGERLGHSIKKLKKKNTTIIFGLFILVTIIVLIFAFKQFEVYVRGIYNYKEVSGSLSSTWISSLASFWGAIFGGIIAGVVSIIGIVMTIRYYRNADSERKINENMPFVNIELTNLIYNDDSVEVLCNLGKGKNKMSITFELQNIGKNFCRTLTYNCGTSIGGYRFSHVIKANDSLKKSFCIEFRGDGKREFNLYLTFMDCFLNEYYQKYDFSVDFIKGKVEVDANYPVLV